MNNNQFTPETVAEAVRSLLRKMGFTSRPAISDCRTALNGDNANAHIRIDMTLSPGEMKMLRKMAGV